MPGFLMSEMFSLQDGEELDATSQVLKRIKSTEIVLVSSGVSSRFGETVASKPFLRLLQLPYFDTYPETRKGSSRSYKLGGDRLIARLPLGEAYLVRFCNLDVGYKHENPVIKSARIL